MTVYNIDLAGANSAEDIRASARTGLRLPEGYEISVPSLREALARHIETPCMIQVRGVADFHQFDGYPSELAKSKNALFDILEEAAKRDSAITARFSFTIDFTPVKTAWDFHESIRVGLEMPKEYGNNLDALWDVLTGFIATPCVVYVRGAETLPVEFREDIDQVMGLFAKAREYGAGVTVIQVE